jgi:dihydrofolate synthase/folylpolyglutamate synthase
VSAAVLRKHGLRTGLYTSPHLVAYNERIRIDGQPRDDDEIIAAFDEIDRARGKTSLTYFEFGTLAALVVFRHHKVDAVVLEVGLGGRLDAVNIVDPDVAVVTSIDIDHAQWLGPDRESIGAEKAGIFRGNRPAIVGDRDPPASLLAAAGRLGAGLRRAGEHFGWLAGPEETWTWWSGSRRLENLPTGPLAMPELIDNAACGLEAVGIVCPPAVEVAAEAIGELALPGRAQMVSDPSGRGFDWIFDVAHNPAAARALGRTLESGARGRRTIAVMGMLADKDVAATIMPLAGVVDEWRVCDLSGDRGLSAASLTDFLLSAGVAASAVQAFDAPEAACAAAARSARGGDLIVVTGSFHVVGPASEWLGVYSRRAEAAPAQRGNAWNSS